MGMALSVGSGNVDGLSLGRRRLRRLFFFLSFSFPCFLFSFPLKCDVRHLERPESEDYLIVVLLFHMEPTMVLYM